MFDLDPRDIDSRDEERHDNNPNRGSRGGSGDGDRDDDWRQPGRSRERDDDARTLGRGPGNDRASAQTENDARDRRDDARWPDRDREPREHATDPRDTFTRHVPLPRGPERATVRDRDREYTLTHRRPERRGQRRRSQRWTGRGVLVVMTTAERVQAVVEFGFMERQARFLVLVMRHAGVCVPRQYAHFADVAYARSATPFSTGSSGVGTPARSSAFTTARGFITSITNRSTT